MERKTPFQKRGDGRTWLRGGRISKNKKRDRFKNIKESNESRAWKEGMWDGIEEEGGTLLQTNNKKRIHHKVLQFNIEGEKKKKSSLEIEREDPLGYWRDVIIGL